MKQARINRYRAKTTELCLANSITHPYETGCGIDAGITDCLCHLRYLCDCENLDFYAPLDRSGWHYDNEIVPDEFEMSVRRIFRKWPKPFKIPSS